MPTILEETHDHFAAVADRLLLSGEKLLRLGEACQVLRAVRGEHARPATLTRWILRGRMGVRLDAVKLGGKGWFTSREALSRFAAALSARAAGIDQVVQSATTGQADRERRARAAMDAMRREDEQMAKARRGSR